MKKFLCLPIALYLGAVHFLLREADLAFHINIFWGSTLPIAAILLNWAVTDITFQEARKNPLRLIVYSASVLHFMLCAVSALGIIPLFPPVLENISKLQYYGYLTNIYVIIVLTIANMAFLFRDKFRRDMGRSL